jgi:hypothetical protein
MPKAAGRIGQLRVATRLWKSVLSAPGNSRPIHDVRGTELVTPERTLAACANDLVEGEGFAAVEPAGEPTWSG